RPFIDGVSAADGQDGRYIVDRDNEGGGPGSAAVVGNAHLGREQSLFQVNMTSGNRARAPRLAYHAAASCAVAPIDGSRMRVQYSGINERSLKRNGSRFVDGLIGNGAYDGRQIDDRD